MSLQTFLNLVAKRLLVITPLAIIFGFLSAINAWPNWASLVAAPVLAVVAHLVFPDPEQK